MQNAKQILKEAIEELARKSLDQQFRNEITANDALDHVDGEMVQAWLEVESRNSTPGTLSLEVFENVPDDQWKVILVLLLQPTDASQALLAGHLRMHVARYLAQRAEEFASERELEAAERPTRRQIAEHNRAQRAEWAREEVL